MSILVLLRFLSSLYWNHPVRLPFSAPVAIFTFAFTLLFIMTTLVVNGVTFDLTITGSNVVATGYDRTICAGLVADTYIKVYDAAVKPKLAQKLTKGLQVTSFDPADLKNTDNFFVFVSNWQNTTIMIESHLKTFYMNSVFNVVDLVEVTPAFSTPSSTSGGAPTITPAVYAMDEIAANLIEEWHSVTLRQVSLSVSYIRQYVSDKVDHDNLIWSFDYIMALCDYDLQHYILSVLEAYPNEIGHTGPMAFHVMATRILQTSDNLAQNVVTGLIQMRLTHFDAENVVELVFTLRNVLKFLNYNTKNSLCPPTIMKILTTIFRGTSVDEFRNYLLDTGCSVSCSGYKSDFRGELVMGDFGVVKTANGEAKIQGFGMVQWDVMSDMGELVTIVAPAYYSSAIAMRLLSPQDYARYHKQDASKPTYSGSSAWMHLSLAVPLSKLGKPQLAFAPIDPGSRLPYVLAEPSHESSSSQGESSLKTSTQCGCHVSSILRYTQSQSFDSSKESSP
jgi:hypothetical protein